MQNLLEKILINLIEIKAFSWKGKFLKKTLIANLVTCF